MLRRGQTKNGANCLILVFSGGRWRESKGRADDHSEATCAPWPCHLLNADMRRKSSMLVITSAPARTAGPCWERGFSRDQRPTGAVTWDKIGRASGRGR